MLFTGIGLLLKNNMIPKKIPLDPIKGYKVSRMKWKQENYSFTKLYKADTNGMLPFRVIAYLHFSNFLIMILDRTNWVNN